MRRVRDTLIVLAILSLIVGGAYAAFQGPDVYPPAGTAATFAITSTNREIRFGFLASWVLIINDGPNTVYVNFGGLTATVNNFPLLLNEFIGPSLTSPSEGVSLITAPGQTASVRIQALQ